MRKKTLMAFAMLFISYNTIAQMPDSVRKYLDSALYFMQAKSIYANEINWEDVRTAVYKKAQAAKNYKDAFPAMAYAFLKLKDYHGMVANQDTFTRFPPPVDFQKIVSAGLKREAAKGPHIVAEMLSGNIAYLRVPTMNVTDQAGVDRMGNDLRDSLCILLARRPIGIVLDLRIDNGGNSAPMISGIGPLFRLQILGYGVDRNGKWLAAEKIRNGVVLDEHGRPMVNIKTSCTVSRNFPVALLIGTSTVSSGEITAAFLKQQPNVRTFGQPTPGFCSATEGFLFCKQNGYLLLTVNRIADAHKKVYKDLVVRPDVLISNNNENFERLDADPAVTSAISWLKNLPGLPPSPKIIKRAALSGGILPGEQKVKK